MNTQSTIVIYDGFKSTCTQIFAKQKSELTFDLVAKIVCEQLKVNQVDALSRSRKIELSGARTIIFYILAKGGKFKLKAIGKRFNRDHSTIIYARDTCQGWIDINKKYKKKVEGIIEAVELARFL